MDDAVDSCLIRSLKVVQSRRYTFRNKHHKRKTVIFKIDLETYLEHSDEHPWLSDEEFLQKYRMNQESFHKLVDLIKDHPVFKRSC